ncbi:hypothetical protein LEP1GSC050_3508 [Leptospira broomii serovar Hurstbridge str. 5399]|uniref:Uncharacterized protein n=1 Tax=Leptospira broomii serovar Hurstbridge str. 5399 TaxID=1049789 RepID=T0FBW9_9LEPT|nr:hypothetical protein LEP1GSC050_3508 [Leptospira broomii serovar Hurstbridge str. 5399]
MTLFAYAKSEYRRTDSIRELAVAIAVLAVEFPSVTATGESSESCDFPSRGHSKPPKTMRIIREYLRISRSEEDIGSLGDTPINLSSIYFPIRYVTRNRILLGYSKFLQT